MNDYSEDAETRQRWYTGVNVRRFGFAFGVVVVIGLALFLYNQRSVSVLVASVERDVPITVFGLGTVEARVVSEIGFEVGASLIELHADHGDLVSKGTVLARLHSDEQQARAAKAQAGVAIVEATLNMAQVAVNKARVVLAQRKQANQRKQGLLAQNTVSEEAAEDAQLLQDVAQAELAVALSEIEVADARLADAQAQLDYENVLLDHHELRAPYDGIVTKRHHELGSVLIAGESLFTLVDNTTVWVLAYVDESRAGDIQPGQPAEVRLRSLPQEVFQAHVARIDIESDRVNEERRVYVACEQCPERFHLGEQAEVFITTKTLSDAILIPEMAITGFDGGSGSIWVVNDKQLHRKNTQFGARTLDGQVVIADDLKGALAVTNVDGRLREGRRASVDTRTPQ